MTLKEFKRMVMDDGENSYFHVTGTKIHLDEESKYLETLNEKGLEFVEREGDFVTLRVL